MRTEHYEALRDAINAEVPAATARVVAGPGAGADMVLIHPGTLLGSLGDPEADARARDRLASLLRDGDPCIIELGDRRVFVEAHRPPPHLVIIGAVHIAIPLVTFGGTLGYRTTVIDARAQFATDERFPHADRLIEAWPDEALRALSLHPGVAAVCLAHDPKFEDPAMEVLLRSDVGYIGAVGSRATSDERHDRLKAAGFSEEELARIHGPVGLNIGGRSPEEIALSIMAEIVAVRHGRDPKSLATVASAKSVS
ncbi:MAG TPA: XdhC/CoxI family protein [Thermomicrobiales bacterium]|nr:XdhC/CoxI family protein [Thermomicrobiales bacterium]